ncbi:hypothetical protein PV327_007586 [Microctonus hyperodae]|uniref:Peptidase M12B domain-containing protein n=1 Tax=Microctonus hyperodae TaxID=165561 RepID=A0AA39FZT9_MICHY|nr:hypothetical protein PV327_007586 [Microctonus hyperodae]
MMRLILLQLVIFVVINAEYLSLYNNNTNRTYLNPLNYARFKRSFSYNQYPKILNALIKTKLGKYIHLEWVQTDQYLANEYLPVWKASEYHEKLDTNQIMKDIGHFITYHDVQKSSAVVYFEKTDTLHGVIGSKYYIDALPIELLYKCHKVDEMYVKKRKKHSHDAHKFPRPSLEVINSFADCNLPSTFIPKFNSKAKLIKQSSCSSTSDTSSSGTSQTDSIDEKYYVETLVFIGHDIIDLLAKNTNDKYLKVIKDHIVYFNAVDMMMAKLKKHGYNIYINLAGIIIENKPNIFTTLFKNPNLKYSKKNENLNCKKIDLNIDHHFAKHKSPFVQGSFDLIFLMTSRTLEHNGEALGLTFSGKNIYHMRKHGKTYDSVPISVMKLELDYDNYCSAAHEIGHSFEINHDPVKSGEFINGNQCYGIMQRKNSYCLKCMKWSKESVEHLKKYILENRNRCFLLNHPRSLYPNKARKFVSPKCQCQCYGFDSYDLVEGNDILETADRYCNSPLLCKKMKHSHAVLKDTILPLDGTPCGKDKIEQYLANKNLPVWIATEYRDKLDTNQQNELNIMDDFGDFIMYQDIEQSSAVVFFESTKTFHGVIGTNYILDDLPIDYLHICHNVGGKYVKKRYTGFHSEYNYPDVSSKIIESFFHLEKVNMKPSTSHHVMSGYLENIKRLNLKKSKAKIGASCHPNDDSENYYLETLIFVTYDITKSFEMIFQEEYLIQIVSDYIILFNAVDMLLAKLQKHDLNIHINLAGIIIENEKDIFSSLFDEPDLEYSDSKSIINVDDIYIGIEDHFETHRTPFTPDSFDLIFFMTSYLIEHDGKSSGVTFAPDSIYDKRKENKPYRSIPITVMQYKTDYADYFIAAHEIGHVENRNRCFFLNYPRSLYPNQPRKFLSPCRQCHCYGFASYGPIVYQCSLEIPDLGCMSPLPCMNTSYSQPIQEDTILPLDGTPCGIKKVCWQGKCVRV